MKSGAVYPKPPTASSGSAHGKYKPKSHSHTTRAKREPTDFFRNATDNPATNSGKQTLAVGRTSGLAKLTLLPGSENTIGVDVPLAKNLRQ